MPVPPSFAALVFTMLGEPAATLADDPSPARIEGGRPTEPGEYESVVALRVHQGICSGVMVSSTIMLTAAHCVDDTGFGRQGTMYYGTTVDQDRRHQAVEWAAHPSYCADCQNDQLDFGYVILTLPYEPEDEHLASPLATQDEWDELMHEGRALRAVGYGSPDESGIRTQRVAEVELSGLTRSGLELHTEQIDGHSCGGDSGGPLFATGSDGVQRLVGIHSRSTACSGTMMTATAPYPALCWLRDETGLDLLPPETADCSALDIGHGGCRVDTSGDPRLAVLLLGLLAAIRGRRRTAGNEMTPVR